MSEGLARRAVYPDLRSFAADISGLDSADAIALGALRTDLPDSVRVTTKFQLDGLNGSAAPDLIARTSEFIRYRPGVAALAMIDIDTKGLPPHVQDSIAAAGGYWGALVKAIPDIASAARVERRSTSTGIFREDTGDALPGSQGLHIFVLVRDGADIERFLRTLHQRCWLCGFGWMMVGAGGQLLERSIVDRMVYAPERLVFEGAPVLLAPLRQDAQSRQAAAIQGEAIDSLDACRLLTIVEQAELRSLRHKESYRLRPDADKVRQHFIKEHGARIAKRTGVTQDEGERTAASQTVGTLLPSVVLPFDDPALAAVTVGDILASPASYVGATLADPLEGIEYGAGKAKVMQRADGTIWVHSFAHGRTIYNLCYDATLAAAVIAATPDDKLAGALQKVLLAHGMTEPEVEELKNSVVKRSGVGKRALDAQIKQAKRQQADQRRQEAIEQQAAERLDRRPQIPAPLPDAPWLPQMEALNDVLGASAAREPPMRDIDGVIAEVRSRSVPMMHALTPDNANGETDDETRLPPPEQPLLTRLADVQLAELIERHIDYTDPTGRSVHLSPAFVRHYHTRSDGKLPTVAAVSTLPLVLPDGTLLVGRGLDKTRGIVFRIASELRRILPNRVDCGPGAVAEAMRFLADEWLADVATDYTGKCILIAAAATVIQRVLLPDRPAFFVTAGRRGGGKTTTLIMLLVAVTGVRPSAAAWSTNEEERRKALLAYLSEAVPAIVWDNIVRGTQISCPHVEKSCTAAFYSDRKLGASELISVAASAIHFFTGNNISPKGDLASRSLAARLEIDRADPENRPFLHPDPIGWTEANRGRILQAIYTILLGNPVLRTGLSSPAATRFKAWWRVAGSAIENAAKQHAEHISAGAFDAHPTVKPQKIEFKSLFLAQEEDDEESSGLADTLSALASMAARRPRSNGQFTSVDLAADLNSNSEYRLADAVDDAATVRDWLFPKGLPPGREISSISVGKLLKQRIGEPVQANGKTLILRSAPSPAGGGRSKAVYFVQTKVSP